LILGLIAQLG